MTQEYYIGFDLGSSSVKVAIVDAFTGENILSLHEPKNEMSILSEQIDWAEQNPEDWWTYICKGTKRAINESKIDASRIKAIGISYQMHGLVCVDRNKEILRPAIIWCDSRAVETGQKAEVEIDNRTTILSENESTYIPLGSKHRLTNPDEVLLILIEVQIGSYLGEDDIIRFDDIYGRN